MRADLPTSGGEAPAAGRVATADLKPVISWAIQQWRHKMTADELAQAILEAPQVAAALAPDLAVAGAAGLRDIVQDLLSSRGDDRNRVIARAECVLAAAPTPRAAPEGSAERVALDKARNALVALRPVIDAADIKLPGIAGRCAAYHDAVAALASIGSAAVPTIAPPAPARGVVDLAGVEALIRQYAGCCIEAVEGHPQAGNPRDVLEKALDAVRALVTPAADVAALVDAYRDAVSTRAAEDAMGRPYAKAKQNDEAETAARLALDAHLAARGRDPDGRGRVDGAGVSGLPKGYRWEPSLKVEVVHHSLIGPDGEMVGTMWDPEDARAFDDAIAALGRDATIARASGTGSGVSAELRRLSEAATPGPWTVIAGDDYIVFSEAVPTEYPHHFKGDDAGRHVAWLGNRAKDFGRADADLIARLVNDLRARISAEDRAAGTAPARDEGDDHV